MLFLNKFDLAKTNLCNTLKPKVWLNHCKWILFLQLFRFFLIIHFPNIDRGVYFLSTICFCLYAKIYEAKQITVMFSTLNLPDKMWTCFLSYYCCRNYWTVKFRPFKKLVVSFLYIQVGMELFHILSLYSRTYLF